MKMDALGKRNEASPSAVAARLARWAVLIREIDREGVVRQQG
jgi:hypothetical protein